MPIRKKSGKEAPALRNMEMSQHASAQAMCVARKPNGAACANEAQFECENGHVVCFFHSIRTIGAQSVNKRKCVACMEQGKTSFVHRRGEESES